MTGASSNGIYGQFVKIDAVATRKVVRLHIECPIEYSDKILQVLGGYPDPSQAQWVALAPLEAEPTNTLVGGEYARQAGILCGDPDFQKFCASKYGETPKDAIYHMCNITSRAHLDHNEDAAKTFRFMRQEFDFWKAERDITEQQPNEQR